MIKKFANVPLPEMLESGNYDLNNMSTIGAHKSTFLVPSLHNFTLQSPLQTKRALPTDAPSSRRLAFELICSFVIYDAVFFLFHLALHMLPGLRNWHHAHHSHAEMHPQITNQLSIFERLGLVLLANFSLNIIGSHVLTRTFFIPIFIWLLVEIHTGRMYLDVSALRYLLTYMTAAVSGSSICLRQNPPPRMGWWSKEACCSSSRW